MKTCMKYCSPKRASVIVLTASRRRSARWSPRPRAYGRGVRMTISRRRRTPVIAIIHVARRGRWRAITTRRVARIFVGIRTTRRRGQGRRPSHAVIVIVTRPHRRWAWRIITPLSGRCRGPSVIPPRGRRWVVVVPGRRVTSGWARVVTVWREIPRRRRVIPGWLHAVKQGRLARMGWWTTSVRTELSTMGTIDQAKTYSLPPWLEHSLFE
jgi:hypothetical protein